MVEWYHKNASILDKETMYSELNIETMKQFIIFTHRNLLYPRRVKSILYGRWTRIISVASIMPRKKAFKRLFIIIIFSLKDVFFKNMLAGQSYMICWAYIYQNTLQTQTYITSLTTSGMEGQDSCSRPHILCTSPLVRRRGLRHKKVSFHFLGMSCHPPKVKSYPSLSRLPTSHNGGQRKQYSSQIVGIRLLFCCYTIRACCRQAKFHKPNILKGCFQSFSELHLPTNHNDYGSGPWIPLIM